MPKFHRRQDIRLCREHGVTHTDVLDPKSDGIRYNINTTQCELIDQGLGMRFLRKGSRRKTVTAAVTMVCVYLAWHALAVGSPDHVLFFRRSCQHTLVSLQKTPAKDFTPAVVADISNNVSEHKTHEYIQEFINNNISDISLAYRKKWVGFPEMSAGQCVGAYNGSLRNNDFLQQVGRVFPDQYISDSKDCLKFIQKYGYSRNPYSSREEMEFPLAFIILFYKDLDQVLFLLRAVYRPHNVYCLTVDTKVSIEFLEAVKSVVKCLPNVFIASKLEKVVYSGFTRLMADIDCMDDLVKHPVQWKYVLNIPGQQFPLRTNLELVKILTMYNGANDIEGITGNRMLPTRFKFRHKYMHNNVTGEVSMVRTSKKNRPPPYQLVVVKGSAYGTFSRAFVQFVINDPVAKELLEWSRSVSSPDEYFWATLHHSRLIRVPGGYTGVPDKKPWIATYASWQGMDPCATIHTRSICIFSPEDLPHLLQRHELFANKFYITHHPAALHCLDEMLFNLTFSGSTRDLSFYQNLPFALKAN